MRGSLNSLIPQPVRRALRPAARMLGLAAPPGAWDRLGVRAGRHPFGPVTSMRHSCNVCDWSGTAFLDGFHCEMATCPRCGSISRDRFLMMCLWSRTSLRRSTRMLETSPRLGDAYRRMMRRSFSYTACDFDQSAHEGDIRIDLQDIDLADSSVDIVVTPHVLEHVPDTARALREIHRILSPGGRMYLQIPLCRGTTAVPETPEFHADNTPVFFNFGWDLTDSIRSAGFDVTVLVTEEFFELLSDRAHRPVPIDDGFDLPSMWEHVQPRDLAVAADRSASGRLGLLPAHQFVTWECVKQVR